MTEQEIMQLAKDAGFDSSFSDWDGKLMICSGGYDEELITDELRRFANLVAEREREACAKMCDDMEAAANAPKWAIWTSVGSVSAAIRARGGK